MKAIVHIGMQKTGSTALQGCLSQSAAYLAGCGVLYPKNHHRLLLALIAPFEDLPRRMKGRALSRNNLGDRLQKFIRHVRRQIETQRPEGLILSTEGLFVPLPEDRHAPFRQFFDGVGAEPGFVAYLRRPSEHYLSSLQQRLKASAIVRPPRPKPIRKVLESYDACFGPDAVSARLFHRDHLENGDIVADFCKHCLAEFQIDPARLTPGDKTNETLSGESMDILQRYRTAFHAERNDVFTEDTKALRVALAAADRRHGAGRPKLRPGVAETVDYANRDCLWVRDRFGVVFPGLDYDRLAAKPPAEMAAEPNPTRAFALEEVVVIDRELRAQILGSVAQSLWAAEDAARKVWLTTLDQTVAQAARQG